jgi:hypothetical protein
MIFTQQIFSLKNAHASNPALICLHVPDSWVAGMIRCPAGSSHDALILKKCFAETDTNEEFTSHREKGIVLSNGGFPMKTDLFRI